MADDVAATKTAQNENDGLRAGLIVAAVVALGWTLALAVRDLQWGQQMYDRTVELSGAAGTTMPVTPPYLFEHWAWILQQGTRVLVGGAIAAALVHRGRPVSAAAAAAGLALLGPVLGSSPVLGPLAPGPDDSLVIGVWLNAVSLLVALVAPGVCVLLLRGATAPSRAPVGARPAAGTVWCTVVACGAGAAVMLTPRAGDVSAYGVDPETWSALAAMTLAVVATSVLVAGSARPRTGTVLLLAAGSAVSLTSALIDTRADTVLSGGVLVIGPAVVLLAPAARTAWRRAFRHGPHVPLTVSRTTSPA